MRILTTFPGKFGDVIWACPSLRALAEATGAPVDLAVAAESASICPLLEAQPYIGKAFAIPEWIGLAEPHMPWQAPRVAGYDAQVDLGYRGWPDQPLAQYTFARLRAEACWAGVQEGALALERPWITAGDIARRLSGAISVGFSDDHFELKYGLLRLLHAEFSPYTAGFTPLYAEGSRWQREGGLGVSGCDWLEAARVIAGASLFLGCCSALHVLAIALGVPVVMMEPSAARHNDIFYPLGKSGPQVTLVTGNDGLPTWDARAVAEAVRQGLEATR